MKNKTFYSNRTVFQLEIATRVIFAKVDCRLTLLRTAAFCCSFASFADVACLPALFDAGECIFWSPFTVYSYWNGMQCCQVGQSYGIGLYRNFKLYDDIKNVILRKHYDVSFSAVFRYWKEKKFNSNVKKVILKHSVFTSK